MFEGSSLPSKAELLRAIAERDMTLHVQPKLAIASGRPQVVGGEALLRWLRSGTPVYSPIDIISAAQRFGIMRELNEFILSETAAVVTECDRNQVTLPIAFNLSRCEFEDAELPQRIARILEANSVSPSRLIVEITEDSLFPDRAKALTVLDQFRELGFALSLDDFGNGFASVTDLYRLPISEVKLDRSLILDLDFNVKARTVLRGLSALMRELGLPICAEGVETRSTLEFLREAGCQMVQGYYFSPPVPVDSFVEIAKAHCQH